MMIYREATEQDAEKIAALHAQSWQQHYRGIWLDSFLDKEVEAERLSVWTKRMRTPKPNQYILVAENDGEICGFICVLTHENPTWGALIDNLHVAKAYQGQKIGYELMKQGIAWIRRDDPRAPFYLWVLEKNTQARAFYERMGATNHEVIVEPNPGGGFARCCRYTFTQ